MKRVGRPNGPAKKVSDAQRIRRVLNQFGVLYPTAKVRSVLAGRNKRMRPENQIDTESKAFGVKVAQVRSTMVAEQTGVEKQGRGRYTTTERDLIEARLELEAA